MNNVERSWSDVCVWALGLMLTDASPVWKNKIDNDVKTKVASNSLRFNIVSIYSLRPSSSASSVIRWYWDNYVHSAFDIRIILIAMKKCKINDKTISFLVEQKKHELKQMIQVLSE